MNADTQQDAIQTALAVMGRTLESLSSNYQRLFEQPASLDYCREAGETLRCLIEGYASMVNANLSVPTDEEGEDWPEETEEVDDD
jgi:hypothetical protein